MKRSIPTGKLSKLMSCIIESPIEMPKRPKFKGFLDMNDILDNFPEWSPKGRVVDGSNHCKGITFKHNTREL